jgi:peptide/nickel transport system substrate-binding protein
VRKPFRSPALGAFAGAVAVTMLVAACSSGSSSTGTGGTNNNAGTGGTGGLAPGWQGLNPGTGKPQYGGTLNEIGVSDVNFMDYDTAYYTTDQNFDRMTLRNLYGWPAVAGPANFQPAPDLATALPTVSPDGLTETVTLRSGVMWDSTPARQVTAADAARGIKRACNPSPVSFGGMADFEATIVGLTAFCQGYPKAAATNAAALKAYVEGHNVPGIVAKGQTLTFHLTHPAAWFTGAMTLGAFTPTPEEALNALPGSPGVYNNLLANGPYKMVQYTPKKSIKLVRNPVWKASTDPLRKAYVDAININETGNQTTIYQEVTTGSPAVGMTWDSLPPPSDTTKFLNEIKSGGTNVNLGSTFASNPYLAYNTISPNNGGALKNPTVRQALNFGIERSQLTKALGGPVTDPPLTHVLPPGIDGSQDVPAGYDPYPFNPGKAKSMLASAGFTASKPLALKLLYRSDSQGGTKSALNIAAQLNALGSVKVTLVATNQSDFYGKYLSVPTTPSPASQGTFDMFIAGWGPDWFGNAATSYFLPLFSSPGGFPTNGGSNFGYFSDPKVSQDISQALTQKTEPQADTFWAKADQDTMAAAAFYPITATVELAVHAPYVHNAVFMTQWQQFDETNLWLDPTK